MHQFPPPEKPDRFDDTVKSQRESVAKLAALGKLVRKKKKKKAKNASGASAAKKPAEIFPAKWSAFKDKLSLAQHRKCAFCEGFAIGQGFGDVEHYSPKAEIEALDDNDPSSWGVEKDNLANVEGRRPKPVSETGYWWLAYEWDNYILACAICNQQWKRAIFPIAEARTGPPKPNDPETHYILHPFRGPAPKDHLVYGLLGEIEPRNNSQFGRETIRTLGLDRPSLREQRRALASKVHKKIDGLANASIERRRELLGDLLLEGAIGAAYCGMVRSIFEQRVGLTWKQLEEEFVP
jgi:hypothetical protein